MAKSRSGPAETTQEVRFPLAGIDLTAGFGRQPNANTQVGVARTTLIAENVRAFEPTTGRGRGGQRPGCADYISGPVETDGTHVQELQAVTVTGYFALAPAEGGGGSGGGAIPGSDFALAALAMNSSSGVSVSSASRAVWNIPSNGAENKSLTIAAIAVTDDGITVATIVDQEAVFSRDGQEFADRIAIPSLGGDRIAVVTADSANFYFFGTTTAGVLVGLARTSESAPVWSQSNIGATSDLGTETTGAPAAVGVTGGICYVNLRDTGIVQVTAATGVAVSPFILIANAAITTAAGSPYRNAGQFATNGTRAAILVATETAPYFYGVVYVVLATGVATAVRTGLVSVDEDYPWQTYSGESYLTSDGTHFYLMEFHFERNASDGQKYSRVVKLDGTTGAVLWTSEDLPVAAKAIGYGSYYDTLSVSNAYGLLPASGAVYGGGTTPSFDAFFDAGSFSAVGLFAGGGAEANASQYNRTVLLLGVSGGTVKVSYLGLWVGVTSGDNALNEVVSVVRSTVLNGRVYFLDTTNWKYYDSATNAMVDWFASAGVLPVDNLENKPRLICTWRGRIVISGLPMDPQNWFMSKVNDATDWDYFPVSPSSVDATFGGATDGLGKIGDPVTCLIPYTDDILIIGGDHSIYMLKGDPLFGGQIDLVTNTIGMAWGNPWCRDPGGTIYFMSSQCQIYTLRPGEKPVQISLKIHQILDRISLGSVVVRLGWNEVTNGVHVFVTPFGRAQPATHFYYEARSGAWFVDRFSINNLNPMAILQFYGSSPRDRVLLFGSWDGTVRGLDVDAPNDDGFDINSDVVCGPFTSQNFEELILKELQGIMGSVTSSIRWDVYSGETAEEAIAGGAVVSGVWETGRSYTEPVRVAGHSIYVRLRTNRPWSMEALRVKMMTLGASRARDAKV